MEVRAGFVEDGFRDLSCFLFIEDQDVNEKIYEDMIYDSLKLLVRMNNLLGGVVKGEVDAKTGLIHVSRCLK